MLRVRDPRWSTAAHKATHVRREPVGKTMSAPRVGAMTEQTCRHCSKTTRMFRCRACNGYGAVDGTYCRSCKGNGEVCQHCEKPN